MDLDLQGRSAFGFEIDRNIYKKAKDVMLSNVNIQTDLMQYMR